MIQHVVMDITGARAIFGAVRYCCELITIHRGNLRREI
jgi:hypothetical protein